MKLKGRASASEAEGCQFDSGQGLKMTPRKPIPSDRLCPNCQRRRMVARATLCNVCITILRLEGKHPKRASFLERFKEYCRWFDKGLTHEAIAEKMGLSRGYVNNIPRRAREKGYDVPERQKPQRKDANKHGGGSVGKTGCDQPCCTEVRSEYKSNWYNENRKQRGVTYAKPRMGHGEGSRGIAGCKCELCRQRRIDYKRDWIAKRKEKEKLASVAQPGQSC